jgi:hypothetical protein
MTSTPAPANDPFAGLLPPTTGAAPNPFAAISDKDWAAVSAATTAPVSYGAPANYTATEKPEGRKRSDAEVLNAYQSSSAGYSRVSDERIDHGKELPIPLIVISILDFAWSAFLGLIALILVLAAGFLAQVMPLGGIGLAIMGLYLLADAAAYIVTGVMLYTRKTWGWYVAVSTHTLGFCAGLTDLISYIIFNGMNFPKFFGLGVSGYALWVLSVLYSDEVRDRFKMRADPTKVMLIIGTIMLSVGFAINLPINYFASVVGDNDFNWDDNTTEEFDPEMDEGPDEGF